MPPRREIDPDGAQPHRCPARTPQAVEKLRVIAALLLSVPLFGSTLNHLFHFTEPPLDDGSVGAQMWTIIRDNGLMDWLAAGHLVLGLMLLIPRTRFAAGVLQLPITLGIVAFNVSMFPKGVPLALAMLLLNLAVVANGRAMARLIQPDSSEA
ncbi:MAG: hypothetical protein ACI8WY_000058 [Planctomycetota bacterium]|jgi:hypothetical protein